MRVRNIHSQLRTHASRSTWILRKRPLRHLRHGLLILSLCPVFYQKELDYARSISYEEVCEANAKLEKLQEERNALDISAKNIALERRSLVSKCVTSDYDENFSHYDQAALAIEEQRKSLAAKIEAIDTEMFDAEKEVLCRLERHSKLIAKQDGLFEAERETKACRDEMMSELQQIMEKLDLDDREMED